MAEKKGVQFRLILRFQRDDQPKVDIYKLVAAFNQDLFSTGGGSCDLVIEDDHLIVSWTDWAFDVAGARRLAHAELECLERNGHLGGWRYPLIKTEEVKEA